MLELEEALEVISICFAYEGSELSYFNSDRLNNQCLRWKQNVGLLKPQSQILLASIIQAFLMR